MSFAKTYPKAFYPTGRMMFLIQSFGVAVTPAPVMHISLSSTFASGQKAEGFVHQTVVFTQTLTSFGEITPLHSLVGDFRHQIVFDRKVANFSFSSFQQ